MNRVLQILLRWYLPCLAVLVLLMEWLRLVDLAHPRLVAFRGNVTHFILSRSGQVTLLGVFVLWFVLLIWMRAQLRVNRSARSLVDARGVCKTLLLLLAFYGYVSVQSFLPAISDARSFLLGIDQSTNILVLVAGIFLTELVRTVRMWIQRSEPFSSEQTLFVLALVCAATVFAETQAPLVFKYREQVRWTGLWINPNTYGLIMGVGIVVSLGLASSSTARTAVIPPGRWLSMLFVAAAVLCAVGVLYSYSRGAWLSASVAALYLAYGFFRSARFPSAQDTTDASGPGSRSGLGSSVYLIARWARRNQVILLLLMISAGFLILMQARAVEWHPAKRILSIGNSHDFSWRNRVSAWEGALQMMSDRAWLGFGWGQPESVYEEFYRSTRLEESMAIQLNDFLTLGATLGIPALFFFATYVWLSLTRRRSEESAVPEMLHWTCRAGAVALLIGFWFDGGLFKLATGALFWILSELGAATYGRQENAGQTIIPRRGPAQTLPRFPPSGINGLKNIRAWLTIAAIAFIAAVAVILPSCLKRDSALNDPMYQQLLAELVPLEGTPVAISPNGEYLLLKRESADNFQLEVLERKSGKVIAASRSRNPQSSMTWRPDSRAIVFQEYAGKERPIRILDLVSGKTLRPNIPISETALPPLRWAPDGSRLACFAGTWIRGNLLVYDAARNAVEVLQRDTPMLTDFCWSPDGQQIATATSEPSGEIIICALKSPPTSLAVKEGAEVRQLAWSPDGQSILATARGSDDPYARLWEVNVATRKVSFIAENVGDISRPLWVGRGDAFLYQVNSNGIFSTVLGTTSDPARTTLEPTLGSLRITSIDSTGTTAYARGAALAAPSALWEISLETAEAQLVYPHSLNTNYISPNFISIPSSDGVMVPAFHWQTREGDPSAVLIFVHGGVHSQALPDWEPSIQFLVKQKCDVISVNYRGSSGYGQSFERADQRFNSVMDVIAARNYAVDKLKVPEHRVYLMGLSKGAPLAASAATHGERIGGLILLSWAGEGYDFGKVSHAFPISVFHGTDDRIVAPEKARKAVHQLFPNRRPVTEKPTWHVFDDEGHHYNRGKSWARVYWEVLVFMRRG